MRPQSQTCSDWQWIWVERLGKSAPYLRTERRVLQARHVGNLRRAVNFAGDKRCWSTVLKKD